MNGYYAMKDLEDRCTALEARVSELEQQLADLRAPLERAIQAYLDDRPRPSPILVTNGEA